MVRTPKSIFNGACFLGVFESSVMTDDFFRNRLDQMIDLRHPRAVLAKRMPWQEIEASLAQRWARQVKAGKKIETDTDFALALLEEKHVAAVQGAAYGMSPYLRISYATDTESLREACARIQEFCKELA